MNLLEQLQDFLNKQPNKEDCITAQDFKDMFILGFISQMQIEVEKFFKFEVIDCGNGDCNIVAKLKQSNETTCHILNEFFLKKNFDQVKQMFGLPIESNVVDVADGIAEIKDNK